MGKSIASRFDYLAMERSMLLGVVVDDDQLTLEMDFCLEPGHPDYEAPGSDDECCFHPGSIRFGGITTLNLERAQAAAGSARSRGRFAIRHFIIEGARCALESEWGAINLQARSIRVLTE